MRILLLDNYDSFTYNLLHLVEKLGDYKVEVFKNDEIELLQINAYHKIILSPGPGLPHQAGIMPALLQQYAQTKSILGVCLGMQAIAQHFGSSLINLDRVYHGLACPVQVVEENGLFKNCPNQFNVARYHSWVIDEKKLSNELVVTAKDEQGHIMAIRHLNLNVCGVQFHPESILSEFGETIMRNWLNA
ncbi:MAG: aminodeoxychorismate/anthranilate synthase component II [Bacteroidota bacterium]